MNTGFNLLTDPLVSVQDDQGQVRACSLPAVLEALGRDEVAGFPALAPHQAHAWHAFLVQLAGLALHRAEEPGAAQPADFWCQALRGLTPNHAADEPWCLIVADPAQPAFLQPPVPEGSLAGFKVTNRYPDEIDVLVTAKNHDLKGARVGRATPEHWLFALLTLQTMQGFYGKGNYGIARMNSGYGSRPRVGLVWGDRPGPHYLRDSSVLLATRDEVLRDYPYYAAEDGPALLWLLPWDGKGSLPLDGLDPWFIEVCRRVRLAADPAADAAERLMAHSTGTAAARLDAKAFNGVVGDPWTPVEADGSKALTIAQAGFTYPLLSRLLLSTDYLPAPMQRLHPADAGHEVTVLVRGLARGQGETRGFHERRVPVPGGARGLFADPALRADAGTVAKERVAMAGELWGKVLRPALFVLFQGGADDIAWNHKESSAWAEPWHTSFDRQVDDHFFDSLWRELAAVTSGADAETVQAERRAWAEWLLEIGREVFEAAAAAAPIPSGRRYQAVARAEGQFHGGYRRHFGQYVIPATTQTEASDEHGTHG